LLLCWIFVRFIRPYQQWSMTFSNILFFIGMIKHLFNKKKSFNHRISEHGFQLIVIIFNQYQQRKTSHVRFHRYSLHLNH